MRKSFILLICINILLVQHLKAQTPQQILYSVYNNYDTLANLTFNIKYTYSSDTAYGDFVYDVLEGQYTMYGKKALFRLGDIEYMQNDSFFVAVYNKDQIMIVSDPKQTNSGSYLPLREQMDSMVMAYAAHYTIKTNLNDSVGQIVFTKKDSLAQFDSFVIEYDAQNKYMRKLEYAFTEILTLPNSVVSMIRNKRLKVEFLNHRFDNYSEELYDENRYLFYENGEYKPVSKYTDFRLFNSKTGK